MNEVKTKIKAYWDKRSSNYDCSPGHVISGEREKEAWKSVLNDKLEGAKKILDIGAGTGFLSLLLAEMGYNVVSIDISEKMLEKARMKAKSSKMNINFNIGDAENLPFKDETFDAVVNRAVLWTLPNPKRAIREWKRVLKPGGMLCFFLHKPHKMGFSQILRKQIGNLLILFLERRNPWNSLYSGKNGVYLPFGGGVEPAVIVSLLKNTGFENVYAEPMTEISKLQRQKMPLRYKIAHSDHIQICYTAIKPMRGERTG